MTYMLMQRSQKIGRVDLKYNLFIALSSSIQMVKAAVHVFNHNYFLCYQH